MTPTSHKPKTEARSGKLRIGDDWNAITIIALSQNNPLKTVAEFVENSIDAHAKNITLIRGKEQGEHYLIVGDDGDGIPKDDQGLPNFKYVATHICDSIKRRLKEQGMAGLQGEFGIGLLSFWTLGEELSLTSSGADGKAYQMRMRKGDPNYSVAPKRILFPQRGTELKVKPLLAGIRQFSSEKIQFYLASELRDRIRQSGAQITIIDRYARKSFKVEPRQYSGRLLHQLPATTSLHGEIYLELYLTQPATGNQIGVYRQGTRVLENITQLEAFQQAPWSSGYLQGMLDAPFLNLTPGTRTGVIQDALFAEFCNTLAPVEAVLKDIIEEQQRAEDEQVSRHMLHTIQKAFREAMLVLPAEDYDWFAIHGKAAGRPTDTPSVGAEAMIVGGGKHDGKQGDWVEAAEQKQFFDYAGPLFSVRISPASCVTPVGATRSLCAIARDRARHPVEHNLTFQWEIVEGGGTLEDSHGEIVRFQAPAEPGLTRLKVTVVQDTVHCAAEALVTVTAELLPPAREGAASKEGLPAYTFRRAPGELWRSRYQADQNVIVINNGHRDFVYASRNKSLLLRYISRLFAKELVYKNFPGIPAAELLERMIELSLYSEEHLK
ncbi:MAG: ATP-binding protein [Gammaproteobacteria bacterium]